MSDLQELKDALTYITTDEHWMGWSSDAMADMRLVVEAARLVANPSWWIEREDGEQVAGPFTTGSDANKAREWVEKVTAPETFWIRQLATALTRPGDTE